MVTTVNPLLDRAPKEVPLPRAPLVRVIAQVRFPVLASVERQDFLVPIQEALQSRYPVLRRDDAQKLIMGPQGITSVATGTIWRFGDVEDAWRVSLSPDFLALETSKYLSRADFVARFELILNAIRSHAQIPVIDRLGLRYIDRIEGLEPPQLCKMLRPEISGVLDSVLASAVSHSISQSLLAYPDGSTVQARWGSVPPNATIDPATIEPVPIKTWILDLDMFRAGTQEFSVEGLLEQLNVFAERQYALFRWVVTDDFLRYYGGAV